MTPTSAGIPTGPSVPDWVPPATFLDLLADSARKQDADRAQYVDAYDGSDANDGQSWGTAKATLASALALLPNGGPLWLSSGDPYNVTGTLTLNGHSLMSVVRGPGGGIEGNAVLRHNFSGDLLNLGATGAHLRNLMLYQDASTTLRTGAAIHAASSASQGGSIFCENVEISGGDGWERAVVLDGSAWAVSGIRKCEFVDLHCFGARTAEETIVITRGVYCTFTGGFVVPAPTAVTQGIKVLDTGSTSVKFLGFSMIGNFYTEAAGSPLGVLYVGDISGNVTCAASSNNNIFIGNIGGTFTNNGGAGNRVIGTVGGTVRTPDVETAQTWNGLQSFEAVVGGSAAVRNGIRRLRVAGATQASNSGLVEMYERLAVSDGHGFNSFPDPGAGGVYANGNVTIGSAGKGLQVKEGTNARMGRATLVAGTVTVSTTAVTAASEVFLTIQTPGGTPGFLRVSARTAGTGFTILSSSGTDTSVVGWMIVEPSP